MNIELLRNKYLYKIFLAVLKYIPMVLGILNIISTLLNLIGVRSVLLSYVGGTSFIFIGLLYIMSYLFNFCYLYRIPLYYLTSIIIINIFRTFGFLPIDLIYLYRIHAIILGIFMSLFIIYMYKNRNNPNKNIDHIKELCKRYGCCS